jgi:hypothetical protein
LPDNTLLPPSRTSVTTTAMICTMIKNIIAQALTVFAFM